MARKKEAKLIIRKVYDAYKANYDKKHKEPFTIELLAKKMGFDNPRDARGNVFKMLSPEYNPTWNKLKEIAKALDVKVSDLFEE